MKFVLFFLLIPACVCAQRFQLFDHYTIGPELVSWSAYRPVVFQSVSLSPRPDKQNPYTSIHLVRDDKGDWHHLLIQTDPSGGCQFIAMHSSLYDLFQCGSKNRLSVEECLMKIDQWLLPSEKTDRLLACLLERINECKR
ncbi:MAG: hypothetical protein ACKO5C_04135 [Ferruginibacter sp.]